MKVYIFTVLIRLSTYIKSLNIVCDPLGNALNSTPVNCTESGYFHSTMLPAIEMNE